MPEIESLNRTVLFTGDKFWSHRGYEGRSCQQTLSGRVGYPSPQIDQMVGIGDQLASHHVVPAFPPWLVAGQQGLHVACQHSTVNGQAGVVEQERDQSDHLDLDRPHWLAG